MQDKPDVKEIGARTAGLIAFNRQRKQDSRSKLLDAAIDLFCRNGYGAVGIEEITAAAGVSRVTFYRHFQGKAGIALDLFAQAAREGAPRLLAVTAVDFRNRDAVIQWLHDLFAGDRDMRGILRVLSQANVEEADFTQQVQPFIADIIRALGETIPAFAIDSDDPACRDQWLRAWLLIYTILDQSNHAATGAGVARDPLMIDVLADSFLGFVRSGDRTG